jgi:DedD protein
MPQPQAVSDEELKLRKRARRRLVGAIFLVALVVVVLPWFVDNDPPPPLKDVNVILPPIPPVEQKFPGEALPPQAVTAEPLPPIGKPAADAAPSRAAIDEPAEAAPAAPPVAAAPAPLPPATAITAQGSSPRAGDRAGAQASPPGPTQPVGRAAADVERGSFVIQVGAFSSRDNARQLLDRMRAEGLSGYLEGVEGATGATVRVRGGPYPSREAAVKARDKLLGAKLASGDPRIIPLAGR